MFTTSADRSQSNAEKYQAREQKFGTNDILPLWVADMDIDTPTFIIEVIEKRLQHPILGYEQMPNSAFEAQIAWMKKHHNLKLKREEMLFSPSVLTSINLAIQAFSEIGDEVIIQPPVYPAFASAITKNQRLVVENPLSYRDETYRFDLEDLESKITSKTKLLILCSPHNPMGRVWNREELLGLAKICLKHQIIVIADEIHCDLSFVPHTPFASLSSTIAKQTITLLSPAKTFNISGLAISTIAIQSTPLRERFQKQYQSTHLGEGNSLAHIAFESAYREGEAWVEALKEHLQNNIDKLDALLNRPSSKIRFTQPEATFLVWLDCRALGLSDEALNRWFIDAKLGLNQGVSFGSGGSGFMRMNFGVSEEIFDGLLEQVLRLG